MLPRPKLTYANVTSTIALFLALGGTSYAVASLPKNSVGSTQLKKGAVGTTQLKGGAVTAEKLADGVAITGPRGPRGAEGPAGPKGDSGTPGPAQGESWKGLGLLNGWSNWGGEYQVAGYRKDGAGNVQLRGVIKREPSPTADTIVATLPAGYRPAATEIFSPDSGGNVVLSRFDVRPNGEVMWRGTANAGYVNVSLSGVIFTPAS
jgi:hypothetical protein